jgi:hypothetical protein
MTYCSIKNQKLGRIFSTLFEKDFAIRHFSAIRQFPSQVIKFQVYMSDVQDEFISS